MDNKHFLTSSIDDCDIINFDRHHHANGNITVVEDNDVIPLKIKRAFYIYDIPSGCDRGGHAHRNLYQLIVAISGCFDVSIDDGARQRRVTLNRPYQGLLVRPGVWSVLQNFSSGAVAMVLASEHYDESDYVRDYSEFLDLTKDKR